MAERDCRRAVFYGKKKGPRFAAGAAFVGFAWRIYVDFSR
jgi:hypothetical protein